MRSIYSLYLLPLALVTMLTGCGKEESTNFVPGLPVASAPPSNTGANADAAMAMDKERRAAEARLASDLKVPFENYSLVENSRRNDEWLTYIAVAHSDQQTPDEELLSLFSAKYYNESDAFKRSDIGKTELPRVRENLERFKAQRFYRIEFSRANDEGFLFGPSISLTTPYDLNEKVFAIGYGNCFGENTYGNTQRVSLKLSSVKPELCKWKVEDIEVAKTVEALRAKNSAHLRGTIYFVVSKVEGGNRVEAIATRMELEVMDKPHFLRGGKAITSFNLQ